MKQETRKKVRGFLESVFFIGCVFLLFTAQGFAQLSTAAVNGSVTDPSGAVVANAKITLTAVETSVEHTTVSNSAGQYVFLNITPGRYTLSVSATGFEPQKVSEFLLALGQTGTIDLKLTIGSATNEVVVQAAAQQLDVTSANLGTVLATQQVNDLPTNGRNFTALLSLTPGVVPVSTGQNSMGGRNGGFSAPAAQGSTFTFPAVNGQTNRSNFFLTDGLNNFGSFLSTYAVPPIIDAVQEVKVVSHTDSAEYGSVTGGVINVVSKQGTNVLHGSAWEFLRNNAFDSRPRFLSAATPKPAFHQNQFGASAGAPVWIPKIYNGKDKTFIFGAYQGFRYSTPSNSQFLVPTEAQLAGDLSVGPDGKATNPIYDPFSTTKTNCHSNGATPPVEVCDYQRTAFPNNQIPADRIDQRMVAWAKFIYPTAGGYDAGSNSNAVDSTPLKQTQNEFNVRGDQNFREGKEQMWFRYSFINSVVTSSGGLPGLPRTGSIPGRNWGGSYTHIFGPSLIAQVQYARTTVQDNSHTFFTKPITDIYNTVGFSDAFAGGFIGNGGRLLPSPGISNLGNGGESVANTPKATDSHQVSGSLTKIFRNHDFKAGGGFISNEFASPLSSSSLSFGNDSTSSPQPVLGSDGNPITTGFGLASFLLGVPNSANRRNVNETTRPGGVMNFFVQDTWKATSKLTINLGVRYDYSFIPAYGTNKTIGQQGGIETGDMDFSNGTYVIQKLPPSCESRGFAPCIPGDGTLPEHVVVDPRGKIAHNVADNVGPRLGFSYRLGEKTVIHAGFGIVYDNWAAVSQMAQNIEGAWPDIGQLITNNANAPSSASPTPTVTPQSPFGTSVFPSATPFNQVTWFYDPHIKNAYSKQWNVGVQRQITPSTAITINYVGSGTNRLVVGGYYNTALTPGPGDPQSRSLYPYIAPTFYDRSNGSANYNAAQVQLDRRYSSGLSFSVGYTYSKSINVGGDGWFGSEGGVPVDPYHPAAFGARSVSGTDLTHVLTENTIYQSPFGRGKRFSTGSGVGDYILGNWQINNFLTLRSGLPYTPIISSDVANTGNVGWSGYEHADLVGKPKVNNYKNPGTPNLKYGFDPSAFASPALYTYGNTGRNSLRSPRFINMDASLFRSFPVWGERKFEFRAEAFNIFNHPNLGTANGDINSSNFGQITGTVNSERQMQLGGKFVF